jgi:hypothetical protein
MEEFYSIYLSLKGAEYVKAKTGLNHSKIFNSINQASFNKIFFDKVIECLHSMRETTSLEFTSNYFNVSPEFLKVLFEPNQEKEFLTEMTKVLTSKHRTRSQETFVTENEILKESFDFRNDLPPLQGINSSVFMVKENTKNNQRIQNAIKKTVDPQNRNDLNLGPVVSDVLVLPIQSNYVLNSPGIHVDSGNGRSSSQTARVSSQDSSSKNLDIFKPREMQLSVPEVRVIKKIIDLSAIKQHLSEFGQITDPDYSYRAK